MKQKILSLLLLGLVCSIGNAWATDYVWNFSNHSTWTYSSSDKTITLNSYDGLGSGAAESASPITLTFQGGGTSDKIQASSQSFTLNDVEYTLSNQLWLNGASSNSRVLSITGLSGKGTMTLLGKTSNNRYVSMATSSGNANTNTYQDIGIFLNNAKTDITSINITSSLNSETTYYINVSGGYAIYALIWTPTISTTATAPTFTPDDDYINGGSTITLSSDGTIYYQWKDEATTLTTESEGWTEGSTVTAPNVTATKILYAYATNGAGLESSVVSKSFNITKVALAAGLSYTTTSFSIYNGQTFTVPTLNNPNNLTGVSYALTGDECVASVDAETGAVTLLGGTGEVRITASTATQGDYAAGSAYYDLEVVALTAVTEKTWAFNNKTTFPKQTLTSLFFSDNLIINATSDKTVSIADSRVELGGAGAANYRNITIKVAPNSRISVTCVSSSSSSARTLNVDKDAFGESNRLGTIAAPGSSTTNYIDYTGSTEATLIIYSTNGGIHVSQIQVIPLISMPITAAKWATFSSSNEVAVPSDVTAYYASANTSNSVTLTEITGGYIPANEGVVVYSDVTEATTFYAVKTSTSASLDETNLLKPNTSATTLAESTTIEETTYYNYTLAVDGGNPIFKRSTGVGTLAAGKAYLQITTNAAAPSIIRIVDEENNATSIQDLWSSDDIVKFIENGQLFILKNGITYDLLGRIVK